MTEEIIIHCKRTLTYQVNARKPLYSSRLRSLLSRCEAENSLFYAKTLTTNVNSISRPKYLFCLHQRSEV